MSSFARRLLSWPFSLKGLTPIDSVSRTRKYNGTPGDPPCEDFPRFLIQGGDFIFVEKFHVGIGRLLSSFSKLLMALQCTISTIFHI